MITDTPTPPHPHPVLPPSPSPHTRLCMHAEGNSSSAVSIVQMLCGFMGTAMFGLIRLSLAVLHWVVTRFLARLFFLIALKTGRLGLAHYSRQFFTQCHGSGNVWGALWLFLIRKTKVFLIASCADESNSSPVISFPCRLMILSPRSKANVPAVCKFYSLWPLSITLGPFCCERKQTLRALIDIATKLGVLVHH